VNIQTKKKRKKEKQTNDLWCDGIYGVFGRLSKKKKSEKSRSFLHFQRMRKKLRIPFCDEKVYIVIFWMSQNQKKQSGW